MINRRRAIIKKQESREYINQNKDRIAKSQNNLNDNNWRYYLLFALIIIPFIYLFFTLFKVQILNKNKYSEIRNNQYKLLPQTGEGRGIIYAEKKNGELFPIAINNREYILTLSPKDIDKKYIEIIYKLINNITEIDKNDFNKIIKKENDSYEELKKITSEEAKKIKELKVNGINVIQKEKRSYPLGSVSSQVIGFVGDGEGGVKGRYGLEKYYNDILQKVETNRTSFFASLFNDIKTGEINNQKKNEDKSLNIVTTLEPNVMKFLNKELNSIYTKWLPDQVSGIIIDSKTGGIIAMDSFPNFDPNNYKDYEVKNYMNPNVQGVYELGSIMKPITISGGIENKLINPETVYRDVGSLRIDNYIIHNHDKRAWGDTTIQKALENSLNLGMIYIMRLMGFEKFRENFFNFKLNEETGIDLPGEVTNQVKNLQGQTEVNYATASFGQGVATTPISMLRALNSIANNGIIVNPHLIKKQLRQDENVYEILFSDKSIKTAISKETALTVKRMMVKSLDQFAGGKYKDENYGMGVKTGTGQLAKSNGGYYSNKTLHSYYAFFPEKETRFSVLIFQVNPKRGESAGETLTSHMQNIKNFLITYYTIPPER